MKMSLTKTQILKLLSKKTKHLAVIGKLDKETTMKIVKTINTNLMMSQSSMRFETELKNFFENNPKFKDIEEKIKLIKEEQLQKAATESIDTLIETNPEKWQELSRQLECLNENQIDQWSENLPLESYKQLVLQTNN